MGSLILKRAETDACFSVGHTPRCPPRLAVPFAARQTALTTPRALTGQWDEYGMQPMLSRFARAGACFDVCLIDGATS